MSNPSFYAVIPANVRYDKSLCANAKLLYGEITALCSKEGYCWANNAYFAELYGVSLKSVSTWIKQLVDAGYIKSVIEYKNGTKEIVKRSLWITYPMEENRGTYGRKCGGGMEENVGTPMEEKVMDINTTIITTKSNKESKGINKFIPPTPQEVKAFMEEREIDSFSLEDFYLHYQANGWMVGRVKMKSWKATILNWHNKAKKRESTSKGRFNG